MSGSDPDPDGHDDAEPGGRSAAAAGNESFAAALLASSPEGVLVVDDAGAVQYEGPTITSFVGPEVGEIAGTDLRQLVHAEDRELIDAVIESLRSGTPVEGVQCRFEPGERDPTRVRLSGRPAEDASVDGHVVSLRVQTGSADLVDDPDEQVERFASMVAHDLRNPLTGAMSFLEVARSTKEDEAFDEVEHSLARMERLIEDLLWLSHEGREIGETEAVDVGEVAREAWEYLSTSEAELVVEDVGTVEGDRDRLLQVFENCYGNAIEHGGVRATVTVGPLPDGFYVEDDGPGIPPEDRESVFESGFTTGDDGTGYGLAIVRRIAEAHGWTVTAEEGDAGGARFAFRVEDADAAE